MARSISISIAISNKDSLYSARGTITDEDTDVQVWVENGYGLMSKSDVAREIVRLADFIDSQQVSGWPL
jgi:hypothetical protein